MIDAGLGALIGTSLGDAARRLEAPDKTRLYEHAVAAGIAVAEGGVATNSSEGIAIAERVGYPVSSRRDFGLGRGVALASTPRRSGRRCRSRLFHRLGSAECAALCRPTLDRRPDRHAALARVAPGTKWPASARSRLATHPGPLGPGSVVQFVGIPAVADATRALCASLGIHGFAGTQFLLDPASGQPLLVEINRRMLPATHSGSRVGIDLAAALAAGIARRAMDRAPRLAGRSGTAPRAVSAGMVSRAGEPLAARASLRHAVGRSGASPRDDEAALRASAWKRAGSCLPARVSLPTTACVRQRLPRPPALLRPPYRRQALDFARLQESRVRPEELLLLRAL